MQAGPGPALKRGVLEQEAGSKQGERPKEHRIAEAAWLGADGDLAMSIEEPASAFGKD